jgi:hypothetical protein
MRFPHSHSLDDDPFVALHTINERSPSHHLIPLGSSFDEKMLVEGEEDSCLVGFSLARMILVARPCGKVGASVMSLANAWIR